MFQGAEARIYFKDNVVVKERVKKSYRLKEIDEELRKTRTKREAKVLKKISGMVNSPKLISVEDFTIKMELIQGKKVSEILNRENYKKICKEIGEIIGKLHQNNIVHGDLTTSNFIYNKKVYVIDFGLSFHSTKIEDKAVDIHLLKHALDSKHYEIADDAFNEVLGAYKKNYDRADEVIKRLVKVEMRGRYKSRD